MVDVLPAEILELFHANSMSSYRTAEPTAEASCFCLDHWVKTEFQALRECLVVGRCLKVVTVDIPTSTPAEARWAAGLTVA